MAYSEMDHASEIDPDRPETWPASAREYLARHRPAPPDPRLRDRLRDEIRANGPMTFACFMERALYDSERGYYATEASRIGAGGDFVTAPTLHPAFGALLCRRVAPIWEALGRPHPFVLAEAGAGTGALAGQILASAAEANLGANSVPTAFATALRYRIIEPFAAWRTVQQAHLAPWRERVAWDADLGDQPEPPHLLLANELLDALPVHRVVRRRTGLRELYVGADEQGELVEVDGALSTAELRVYFDRLGLLPPVDRPVEVSLAAPAWLRRALAAVRGGWVWLLDYGAEAAELFSERRAGTLRAFHGHALSMELFARAGSQDLTADVDFTTLIRTAEAEGWTVEEFTTQRHLLLSLGLKEYLRAPGASMGDPGQYPTLKAQRPAPGRWALLQLVDPHGLGAVRSLLLRDGRPEREG